MTINSDWLLKHFEQISEAPDAVPRLRRFILDLAVRGKLVEQNPEDEPAKILLKNSEQAIAIKHTNELFDFVPQGWIAVKFGQMLSLKKGKKPRLLNAENKGLPYLDIAALERNELSQFTEDMTCPQATADDLIIVCDGSRSGLVLEGREGVLGSTVAAIQFTGFSRDYLRVLLKSLYFNLNTAKKGAAIPHLNIPRFLSLSTALPPLAEQHRIVAKVDELMALCDDLEAVQSKRERRRGRLVAATLHGLNNGDASPETGTRPTFEESARFYFNHLPRLTTRPEHIRQLRQTILNLAVRGKLVPQDPKDEPVNSLIAQIEAKRKQRASEGEPISYQSSADVSDIRFPVPQSWKWVRLGVVTNVLMGQSPPGETYNTHREGIPLINGPVEFSEGPFGITVLNQYTTAPTKLCKKGDLLLCVRGSTTGRTNVAGFDACIGRGVAALQPLYADQFVRLFIWSWRNQIIEMGRGIAFPSISRRQIEDLPTPFPPLAEQHRIVGKVDKLMALCDELEARLTTTATNRRQLLEATLSEAIAS